MISHFFLQFFPFFLFFICCSQRFPAVRSRCLQAEALEAAAADDADSDADAVADGEAVLANVAHAHAARLRDLPGEALEMPSQGQSQSKGLYRDPQRMAHTLSRALLEVEEIGSLKSMQNICLLLLKFPHYAQKKYYKNC